ncbi:hypothetical protein SYNTR_1465 [Candidatus Syntrophocurvum alkaliphilum]|uniref:Uncharacterized protein n=1 Tax=Candidatus Syntrophocurvum alkaliphilum TaxID=2293317 RepID=A0A6I6DBE8_9FIRM|nr:SEC-C metal-binding domain-containing protein [Candidatus Syntrophocurvum alkaliphilum]QGU00059.1 hypothetical protein SYNTR_1465 [Candidatus Syntrophocurvum alkaliphilum]
MSTKDIGRNDPCPCGSGKKYKKCCLELKDIVDVPVDDTFNFYNQLLSVLKLKLDSYYNTEIKKHRKDSLSRFVRFTVDKDLSQDNESFYSDWLWFDKPFKNNQSLGCLYMNENGKYIEDKLLNCLNSLNNSYLSVFKAVKSKDKSLFVYDIILEKDYSLVLKEPLELDLFKNDILLLGRILTIDDVNMFSGMVLMLKNENNQEAFIKNHIKYLSDLHPRESLIEILKEKADIVYGIFDHACRKKFINLNDIRLASLDEDKYLSLIEILDKSDQIEFVHDINNYKWYKPKEDKYGYVRIALQSDKVILSADVLEDITYLQDLIANTINPKEFILISSFFSAKPPDAKYNQVWFDILKDQETEAWLNAPHSEFENKTPLELLQEDKGKTELKNMINSLYNSVSDEQKELLEYMLQRIEKTS